MYYKTIFSALQRNLSFKVSECVRLTHHDTSSGRTVLGRFASRAFDSNAVALCSRAVPRGDRQSEGSGSARGSARELKRTPGAFYARGARRARCVRAAAQQQVRTLHNDTLSRQGAAVYNQKTTSLFTALRRRGGLARPAAAAVLAPGRTRRRTRGTLRAPRPRVAAGRGVCCPEP